jgi:four helix bundle protein
MLAGFGMAHRLEELPLYPKIQEFWHAVTAILGRPGLRRDRDLYEQIEEANDSINANMREGFEQPTDAAFANFVFISKSSLAEVLARVDDAHKKKHITEEELQDIVRLGEPLGKMMGGFIKYLCESGFTDRGRHHVAPRPPKPTRPRRRRPRRRPGPIQE